MCGIAGKIVLKKGCVYQKELFLMSQKIAHRGPDDEGFYISSDKRVGLASRRLAVIDLTKNGHQPMTYLNRYWITYNGEIFNFETERKKMEKEGIVFKSRTDTEVILALYHRYKIGCLKYLRGFFAFAIYDAKDKTVFLARDRLGKKPLKYFHDGNVFLFASEIKAILTQKEVKKEIDWQAIDNYLTYGYVPSPNTGFLDIYKLEPGHFLWIDLAKKTLVKKRYWKLDFNQKQNLSENEWINTILSFLEESTKLRMISDVPLGAFLSGGVDSSAVVATMANLSKKPIKTFTIVFKENRYDERLHARRIAKLYKTEHHELLAEPKSCDILPQIVYRYEEPFADSSALVTFMISELAKKYVTVILNGDGGDENFAGYMRHWKIKRDLLFEKYKKGIKLVFPLRLYERAKKYIEKSALPLSHRFVTYNIFLTNEEKEKLCTPFFKRQIFNFNSYDLYELKFVESKAQDPCDRGLYADFSYWLPDDLLVKMDIATMANSLEGRSPLLDSKFVEMAAQIPYELKVKGFWNNKYIFKKALEKIVPKENLYRPKQGFSIPLSLWFDRDLRDYSKKILLGKKALKRDIYKEDVVREMLKRHSSNNDFGPKLWSLVFLELWFQTYFD